MMSFHIPTARLTVLWLRGDIYVWPWMLSLVGWAPTAFLLTLQKTQFIVGYWRVSTIVLWLKDSRTLSPSVTLDETSGLFWTKNSGSPRRSFSLLTAVICYYKLHHLRTVSRTLSRDAAATLVHVFVTSRLDHCCSVLVGLPFALLTHLDLVICSTARLIGQRTST